MGEEQLNEMIQKSRINVGEQGLVGPHAAGFTGRKDDARWPHFMTPRAKTDFESGFQPGCALRRTPIISATTLTAISSGVMAPSSSPMGEWTRSKRSRGNPSFSSSLTTLMVLRLLPIIPM